MTDRHARTISTHDASVPCVVLRSGDKFGAAQGRITANHPTLIRSFLIDSGGQRALHTVICAKIFHHADVFAANSVSAKCNARGAKILLPKHARGELPSREKPLFHRVFLNFSDARANERCVLLMRAINFDFDRVMTLHRVASCAHTRFVRW